MGTDTEPRRWSIRARLLAIAVGATVAAWGAGGVATWVSASEVNDRLLDERLAQVAQTVLAFASHELAEIAEEMARGGMAAGEPHREAGFQLGGRYHVQIWSPDGRLLLRSPGAPAEARLAAAHAAGFGHGLLEGRPTRTFVQPGSAPPVEVQVAEALADREPAVPVASPLFLLACLASLALVGSAAWWLVLHALRPVEGAEHALRSRTALELTPLPLAGAPREIEPMLVALNALFARVQRQLSSERGFTALAAHELRTPLAALRMQAQVAARTDDALQRRDLLDGLLASVDRCDHLLEQLLTLNRVDQGPAAPATGPVALDAALREVLESLAGEIAARGVHLQADLQAAHLAGQHFGVVTLLRNLVDNAVRHARRGGTVRVASGAVDGGVRLQVDDDGPGIAPEERARACENFVRLQSAGAGVGLGLSIVQSVARAHGATFALLDSPLGGLRVELWFPDARA